MRHEDAPLVAVASFATALEAHLIRGLLQAEGLQVAIADEHLVSANSALAYAIGGVKLLVRAPHLERALRILAAQRRGDYVLADDEADEGGSHADAAAADGAGSHADAPAADGAGPRADAPAADEPGSNADAPTAGPAGPPRRPQGDGSPS